MCGLQLDTEVEYSLCRETLLLIHVLWRFGLGTQWFLDLFPLFGGFLPRLTASLQSTPTLPDPETEKSPEMRRHRTSKLRIGLHLFQLLDALVQQTVSPVVEAEREEGEEVH